MQRVIVGGAALLLVVSVALAVYAQGKEKMPAEKMSAVPQTPEWQKLETLVGQWEGFMEQDGKQIPTAVEVRMTGGGSAIMHLMAKDTPHEMVTMIHPDGKRLLATHYCGAHNQPRMALVASRKPNEIGFEFVDGTNIAAGDTHMRSVTFVFVDADHHEERWMSTAVPAASVFKFTRKK